MFKNNVFDTLNGDSLESPSDAQEGATEASQPNPVWEQGSDPVRAIQAVPATLRVWSPDKQLLGQCKIKTYAKGDSSHFFWVPSRILLNPGVRVEIEVNIE